jgi:protein-S-isoprenylcysteine O-methyltransferase Ste14
MWTWVRALLYMFLIGAGWLVVLPTCLLYWERPGENPILRSWTWVFAGLTVILIGAGLALWAGYYLIHRGGGTPLPLDPPRYLVTIGPYQLVRNPQAIAMLLMVTGELIVFDSACLWVMFPLTVLYLEMLVGPIEARQLAKDFGSKYLRYKARVGKWVPRW